MQAKTKKERSPQLPFGNAGEITERLLQFIWQFQYFNKSSLTTAAGEELKIIFPGRFNTNQGPDFSNAKIIVGNTTWAGHVELHIKTSDWKKHNHNADKNYNNVVLHVVWQHDEPVEEKFPILELKDKVAKVLLQHYSSLMNATGFIACEKMIAAVSDIALKSWKERLLAERLMRKAGVVLEYLSESNFHWEECFWWLLARNFGMKVNADAFEAIARTIPVNILAKHKNQIHQLEALLLGQAGLLQDDFSQDYPAMLKKEFLFLQKKYNLLQPAQPVYFLSMRPVNFPTIRLAQLAMLIHHSAHLFSKIKEADSVMQVKQWFDVTANDYWHYHYRFDEPSAFKKKNLGKAMIENIIINTIAPVLFAYGNYHSESRWKQKALDWLEATAAESNSITNNFAKLKVENKTAFDSQSLIELKTQYCDKKRCLECGIGNAILKSGMLNVE